MRLYTEAERGDPDTDSPSRGKSHSSSQAITAEGGSVVELEDMGVRPFFWMLVCLLPPGEGLAQTDARERIVESIVPMAGLQFVVLAGR